jgi:hypothetical protein
MKRGSMELGARGMVSDACWMADKKKGAGRRCCMRDALLWLMFFVGMWMPVSSLAQSASSPGEGLRAEMGSTPGTVSIKWWGKAGRSYFMQSSSTLVAGSWQYLPYIEAGADAVLSYAVNTTTTQKQFVRLVYTDQSYSGSVGAADFDGDGLSNWAELNTYLTNPLEVDSDGDGLRDGWEVAHGFNPLTPDVNTTDTDGDGLTLLMESLLNTNPHVAAVADTANTAGLNVYTSGF